MAFLVGSGWPDALFSRHTSHCPHPPSGLSPKYSSKVDTRHCDVSNVNFFIASILDSITSRLCSYTCLGMVTYFGSSREVVNATYGGCLAGDVVQHVHASKGQE